MTMNGHSFPLLSWQEPFASNKQDGGYDDSDGSDECELVAAKPCLVESFDRVYEVADVNTIDDGQDVSAVVPSAKARPLHLPEVCLTFDKSKGPLALPRARSCARPTQGQPVVGIRPEFIFASTLLGDISIDDLGLVLERRAKGGVLVAGLSPSSPFLGSNIQPGDHIVAVNHFLCADRNVHKVQELINASKTKLSLCIHNPRGDAKLVSSSVMKPQPTTKAGITLQRRHDVIRIKEMAAQSLFGDSLLTTRQRCRSINGVACDSLTAHAASALIGHATTRVTIVSELKDSCAVSIGVQDDTSGWWHRVASGVVGRGELGIAHLESPLES